MYGTLQRNVESSPGSVLGRLVGESGRAENGGRGEQESESSGPEHVDESKWEARVADADAVSDVDEPEVNGVVRESRFSLAILYTSLRRSACAHCPLQHTALEAACRGYHGPRRCSDMPHMQQGIRSRWFRRQSNARKKAAVQRMLTGGNAPDNRSTRIARQQCARHVPSFRRRQIRRVDHRQASPSPTALVILFWAQRGPLTG